MRPTWPRLTRSCEYWPISSAAKPSMPTMLTSLPLAAAAIARGSCPEPAMIPSGRRAAWGLSGVMAVAWRAQRALAACAYERDDFLHDGMLAELTRDVLDALQQRALVGKQQAV